MSAVEQDQQGVIFGVSKKKYIEFRNILIKRKESVTNKKVSQFLPLNEMDLMSASPDSSGLDEGRRPFKMELDGWTQTQRINIPYAWLIGEGTVRVPKDGHKLQLLLQKGEGPKHLLFLQRSNDDKPRKDEYFKSWLVTEVLVRCYSEVRPGPLSEEETYCTIYTVSGADDQLTFPTTNAIGRGLIKDLERMAEDARIKDSGDEQLISTEESSSDDEGGNLQVPMDHN